MRYSFWNSDLPVQWVTYENPAEEAARMTEKHPDIHCVTATRLMWMIHDAVMNNTKDEFYQQLCTPPKLLIAVTETDIMKKDALQFELTVILSVRRVNHLPTRFIFPSEFAPETLANQSLVLFLHLADRGIPVQRLRAERGLMRRLAEITAFSAELDDAIFAEKAEANEESPDDRTYRMLRQIEMQFHELEQTFARICEDAAERKSDYF